VDKVRAKGLGVRRSLASRRCYIIYSPVEIAEYRNSTKNKSRK
jgi:hypothetical protein